MRNLLRRVRNSIGRGVQRVRERLRNRLSPARGRSSGS